MATTINADSSHGLKLSSDTSGDLELQSNGITKVKITSSGITDTSNNVITSQSGKNLIINGNMSINQRGNYSTTVNSTNVTPAVDRWLGRGKGSAGVFNILATAENSNGFNNHVVLDVTTASTPSGTDSYRFQQMIEGYNIGKLNWGTANAKSITLSFWAKSTLTGTFGGSVANGDYNRFNPFSYTISSANTWEYKTVTIAGDTSGTWHTTSGLGIRLNFSIGAGPDRLGTAGTWSSSVLEGVTGQTNHIATNGSNLRITGVQVEEGTTATPFEHLQYGEQLALCQRYYYKWETSSSNNWVAWAMAANTTNMYGQVPFPTTMRNNPSSIEYSGLGWWLGGAVTAFSAVTIAESGKDSCTMNFTSTGLTAEKMYAVLPNGSNNYIAFNSEL
jgi:hypothetical protein